MNLSVDLPAVPTKLKRVNVTLEPELFEALEAYARRCKRSLSNQVSVVLEQVLISTGDLTGPLEREERRGGKRPNTGRKTKGEADHPTTDEETEV